VIAERAATLAGASVYLIHIPIAMPPHLSVGALSYATTQHGC